MTSFNIQNDQILLSPTRFELRAPEPDSPLEELNLHQETLTDNIKEDFEEGAKTSSKQEKKRLAGMRSRQKKKKYVQSLEENVKALTTEIEEYDVEISKCKDQLVEAIKTSSQHSNEHSYTFGQLEKQLVSEDPDIDRINLLLDLVQNRIGANARERQANLDYTFKQIINSIFPAMHRYLMHSSVNNLDLFDSELTAQELMNNQRWTQDLYKKVRLQPEQLSKIITYKQKMAQKRGETIDVIRRLRNIKGELKKQQEMFQHKIMEFREDLTPIQSGFMAVFGEKNKLRGQFSLGVDFDQRGPRKIVKLE